MQENPSIEYDLFGCFMFHPSNFTLIFKKYCCNKKIHKIVWKGNGIEIKKKLQE